MKPPWYCVNRLPANNGPNNPNVGAISIYIKDLLAAPICALLTKLAMDVISSPILVRVLVDDWDSFLLLPFVVRYGLLKNQLFSKGVPKCKNVV